MPKKNLAVPSGEQVEFICPKCGLHLAWAYPGTEMVCPRCGRWVTEKNRERAQIDLHLSPQDGQLSLF